MIALFALLLAAGQGQDAPATAAVSGSVLDAKTRQPVRRALVRLQPAPTQRAGAGVARPLTALTNEEGRFRITGMTPGDYVVTAQRNGYLTAGSGSGRAAGLDTRVTLAPGDSQDGMTLELMPQAVLAGRVVDDLGEPVMGAMVSAARKRGAAGRGRGPGENSAMTNDRGEFRLYGLTAGAYLLAASGGRGLAPPQESGETAYVTTYYPSVVEAAQAMPLSVGPGDELGSLEIRLRTSLVFAVRGRVALADAAQIPKSCMLYLEAQGGLAGTTRPVANYFPDGRFEFRSAPPGSYLLVGQTTEGENRRVGVVQVEVTRGPVDDVALLLSPGVTVTATVTLEGGDRQLSSTARVALSTTYWTPWSSTGGRPSAEGVIRLDRVLPGRYKPEVFGAWPEAYLARVLWNEQELPPGQPLEVTGSPGTLRLIYRLDGGSLQGAARLGDKPAPGGSVLLLPADEAKRQSPWVRLQPLREDGGFAFQAIAPGDYYVLSAESIETGDWEDPEWLRRMLAKAQKVTISARAEATATVEQQR